MKYLMKTIACSLSLTFSLMGCAIQQEWVRQDAGDFNADNYRCMQESAGISSSTVVAGNIGISNTAVGGNYDLYQACMYSKGWHLQNVGSK